MRNQSNSLIFERWEAGGEKQGGRDGGIQGRHGNKKQNKADWKRGTQVKRLECLFLLVDGIECGWKTCYIIIQTVVLYQYSNEVLRMLKNNIEVDVKIKCIEAGKTQA